MAQIGGKNTNAEDQKLRVRTAQHWYQSIPIFLENLQPKIFDGGREGLKLAPPCQVVATAAVLNKSLALLPHSNPLVALVGVLIPPFAALRVEVFERVSTGGIEANASMPSCGYRRWFE